MAKRTKPGGTFHYFLTVRKKVQAIFIHECSCLHRASVTSFLTARPQWSHRPGLSGRDGAAFGAYLFSYNVNYASTGSPPTRGLPDNTLGVLLSSRSYTSAARGSSRANTRPGRPASLTTSRSWQIPVTAESLRDMCREAGYLAVR